MRKRERAGNWARERRWERGQTAHHFPHFWVLSAKNLFPGVSDTRRRNQNRTFPSVSSPLLSLPSPRCSFPNLGPDVREALHESARPLICSGLSSRSHQTPHEPAALIGGARDGQLASLPAPESYRGMLARPKGGSWRCLQKRPMPRRISGVANKGHVSHLARSPPLSRKGREVKQQTVGDQAICNTLTTVAGPLKKFRETLRSCKTFDKEELCFQNKE